MKRTIATVGLCLAAVLAYGAAGSGRPLNVKTGLWQISKTITWNGLPPQYASMNKNGQTIKYNSCVKAENLASNPWASGSGEKCVWTVLNSTGTDMEVRGESCSMGNYYGMSAALTEQSTLWIRKME